MFIELLQPVGMPVSPHPHLHLVLSTFQIFFHARHCFNLNFLIHDECEHFQIYSLGIWASSSADRLFVSFAHSLIGFPIIFLFVRVTYMV